MAAAPFVVVWKKALRDATMPIGRKSFGAWLETWADRDGTNCFPSVATLARLGYARRSVYRHLAALEADGWLKIQHGGGRRPDGSYGHNTYALCLPAEPNGCSPVTPNRDAAGALLAQSGCSPVTGAVTGEHHDHSLRPLPLTTTPTTPEVTGALLTPLPLTTPTPTPTTPSSSGCSPVTVPPGRKKDDISNPTPAAKAAQTALRERATAAGLDLLDLRDIIFATTGLTRVEQLTSAAAKKVARAIVSFAAELAACEDAA